ncbi:MAG: calcium-binding protein [Pseudomonadota bacterium]
MKNTIFAPVIPPINGPDTSATDLNIAENTAPPRIVGTAEGDLLTGTAVGEIIQGFRGADEILGIGGDDTIAGGDGADTLDGGEGDDVVSYVRSREGVTIDLGAGVATGGHAEGDVLSGFESVRGSEFDDILTGDAADNRLIGRAGDDTLNGGDGNDILNGGRGADLMVGGDGFDRVSYFGATQQVIINTRNDMFSRAAEGDRFVSIEAVMGSGFADSIVLGDANNRIFGAGGNDFLDAGLGSDTLIGGEGADFMHGSDGSDTAIYRGSDAGININMTGGLNTGGHAQGDVLSAIENVRGSLFDDTIAGNILANDLRGLDGNDILTGRAGSDKLTGGAGEDAFVFLELSDHVSQTQSDTDAIGRYAGDTADLIRDFDRNEDSLMLASTAFSGSVFNTNTIADLNLNSPDDSAFAFTGSDLFYLRYASAAEFSTGLVEVTHLATLRGVNMLDDSDLSWL